MNSTATPAPIRETFEDQAHDGAKLKVDVDLSSPCSASVLSVMQSLMPANTLLHSHNLALAEKVVRIIALSKSRRLVNGACNMTALRDTTQRYIARNLPIPMLAVSVPPFHRGLDICELLFLKMLQELHSEVARIYPACVSITLRIEDLTIATHLDESVLPVEHMRAYVADFRRLVSLLGMESFFQIVTESTLMDPQAYQSLVQEYVPLVLSTLEADSKKSSPAGEVLSNLGWKQGISDSFYRHIASVQPFVVPCAQQVDDSLFVARNCATILARRQLHGYGVNRSWRHGYIEMSFVPPPPQPTELAGNRIYLRSSSICYAKCTMPFWRCVGVVNTNGKFNAGYSLTMVERWSPVLKRKGNNVKIKIGREPHDAESLALQVLCLG